MKVTQLQLARRLAVPFLVSAFSFVALCAPDSHAAEHDLRGPYYFRSPT